MSHSILSTIVILDYNKLWPDQFQIGPAYAWTLQGHVWLGPG
jgi:hypothetical protein